MPPEFQLLRPLWLLTLIPLGLLLWRLARGVGAGDAWRSVVDEHLLSHLLVDDGTRVRRLPLALLAVGWLLGVIALAGPVWERLPQPVYQTEARRVIVLDISASMNATDLPPSRLARARFEVLDLLARSGEGQTALLAYGPEPFVVSPLTTDAETIAAQVPNLETALLPLQGDRRADLALAQAGELLRQAGAADGEVILVTDGLDHPAAAGEQARELIGAGYRVSVLGVGTEQGAPVPLEEGGFHKDEQGSILMPRLEPDELAALAVAGAGRYVTAVTGDDDTVALIPDAGGQLGERVSEQDVSADQWREEGPWLLLILLPLAAFAFRRGWLSSLVVVFLVMPYAPAEAFDWQDLWARPDQQAARSFAAGEHALAAERFERPDWRAAAHFEAGDYASALQDLEGSEDAEAAYNRGNAMARLGELEDAIAEYEQVLEADSGHEDARHNLDLLRRLLEQQQQQQQQQGEDQQQSEGDSGSDQAENGDQGQGGESDASNEAQNESGAGEAGQDDAQQQAGQGGAEPPAEGESPQQGDGSDLGSDPGSDRGSPEDQEEQAAAGAGSGEKDSAQTEPETAADSQDVSKEQEGQAAQAIPPESPEPEAQGARGQDTAAAADDSAGEQAGEVAAQSSEGAEPGLEDLLGESPQGKAQAPAAATEELEGGEDRQAMEHMLRRVPDDPGGLLRQRFLLQHLRRSGRLP